ncbi:MAG: CHAT domain-containing protein [Pseudomonadota bacterium]
MEGFIFGQRQRIELQRRSRALKIACAVVVACLCASCTPNAAVAQEVHWRLGHAILLKAASFRKHSNSELQLSDKVQPAALAPPLNDLPRLIGPFQSVAPFDLVNETTGREFTLIEPGELQTFLRSFEDLLSAINRRDISATRALISAVQEGLAQQSTISENDARFVLAIGYDLLGERLRLADELSRLKAAMRHRRDKTRISYVSAKIAEEAEDYDEAAAQYAMAHQGWCGGPYPRDSPLNAYCHKLHANIGSAVLMRGYQAANKVEIDAGLQKIDAAIEELRTLDAVRWLGDVYSMRSAHGFATNDYEAALADIEEAIHHYERSGFADEGLFATKVNHGALLRNIGRIFESRRVLREALQQATNEFPRRALAAALHNLASNYEATAEWLIARRHFLTAAAVYEELVMPRAAALSKLRAASAARRSGDTNTAIVELSALHRRAETELTTFKSGVELAQSHLAAGRLHDAISLTATLAEAPPEAMPMNYRMEFGALTANLATSDNELLDLITFADQTLPQSQDFPLEQLEFRRAMVSAAIRLNETMRIRPLLEASLRFSEKIASSIGHGVSGLGWAGQRYSLVRAQALLFLLAHDLDPDLGFDRRAFETLESYGFSVLFARRRAEVDQADVPQEDGIFSTIHAAQDCNNSILCGESARQKEEQLSRIDFNSDLQRRTDISTLQSALAKDEQFLRILLHREGSFLFSLTSDGFSTTRIDNTDPLGLISKHIELIQSGDARHTKVGARIWKSVFASGKTIARTTRKLILTLPTEAMSLPVAALNIAAHGNGYEPLVSRYEILQSYSARQYLGPQTHDSPTTNDFALFFDPSFARDKQRPTETNQFRPLPWSRVEASKIRESFPTASYLEFSGENATASNLLSASVRNSSIVHLATHGYFDSDFAGYTGIATAPEPGNEEGRLDHSTISTQRFRSRLIYLNGCETAQGSPMPGEGLNSLTRTLIAQGAGSVIGSLWPVSDNASAVFAGHFYRELKSADGDTAAALRKATLAMREDNRFFETANWAGFTLYSANKSYDRALRY